MARKIIRKLQKFFARRGRVLLIVFMLLSAILVGRLFQLQIIHGEEYAANFTVKTTRKRVIKSTRGNIYDVNGKVLAHNELSNSVTIEDNGTYDTTREKNLSLNGEIYQLTHLILEKGDTLAHDFHIYVDENGDYAFDVDEGTSRNRFRADVYGQKYYEDLTDEQANATADDIVDYLASAERFAVYDEDDPYTSKELSDHGLPEELSKEDVLNIVIVRYQLSLISYQRYVPVVVAEDVSDATVAAVEENASELQGVSIQADSKRVYENAEAFASIIGYTGKPSAEELSSLKKEDDKYTSSSIIGKTGIEQYMETTLQGTDGSEEITVDNLGKILAVNEDSRVEPIQGNDVYLTIDSELQNACYQILEQRIAGILLKKIQDTKYGPENMDDADNDNYIPIYDVYNALIENNVIDISHFEETDASETEKNILEKFHTRQSDVISWIGSELSGTGTAYKDLDEEHQAYLDYISDVYLSNDTGILNEKKIDSEDSVYKAYFDDQTISLGEFLRYACQEGWIDVSNLGEDSSYLDSSEIFNSVIKNITDNLSGKLAFSRIIYKYMIMDDSITPTELCQVLYDQNILTKDDDAYNAFENGTMTPYSLITEKIRTLEITPAQLALDPCSGSIVINDPDTGKVLALVTYPGYDNNRLANEMDTDYYNKIYNDLSTPFYNKATQQLTAPGSTFKPVMAAAGLNEGVIDMDTYIDCDGLFGEGLVDSGDQIRCWLHTGHGSLNVVGAIQNSCNVFFCTVGYRLGLNSSEEYSGDTALSKIQEYASMFNLDQKTGLEITESSPQVSDSMAIPSAIGQGTHEYTTAQLSRYAATIANSGASYKLTLIGKTSDPDGNTIEETQPEVQKDDATQLSSSIWDAIHSGMRAAMENNSVMSQVKAEVYGKTGTAQEAKNRPSHSLVIGYSHLDNSDMDDIAFAVRIPHGYGSSNACLVASDVLNYYYNLEDEAQILTGQAKMSDSTGSEVVD
ncbi:MAG: penicillin-binding transpeptidase domain-containing protein [Bilifractor sp.]